MKNLKTFLKKGLAVLLVVLLVSRPVESAHASVSIAAGVALVVSIVSLAQQYGESASVQEREEIRDLTYTCFPLKSEVSGTTVTDGEHLHEMYLELCNLGFPCEIREEYINGSWYYCIVGNGYVDIPKSFLGLVTQYLPIHDRVYTNSDGIAYVSNYKPTSNNYLQWSYEVLQDILKKLDPDTDRDDDGVPDDGVAYWAYQTWAQLVDVNKKLDNLSISGGSLNVTPIVNKLQTTIDAADERLTLLLSDLDGHVDTIVDAIPDPVDLTPLGDRLDTLIAEVQKISTFDARHEVTTIIPGEFGNYETCVVRAGWEQIDDLKFLYNNTAVDYSSSSIYWEQVASIALRDACNGYNDYANYYYDADWPYADHVLKFSWDSSVSYYSNLGNTPFVAEVYTYSDGLVGTYYSNSTESFFVSATDFDYMHITMPSGAGRYFDSCGTGSDLMTVHIGMVTYPPAEEFNLTVDGRHGQYFFYGDLYGIVRNGWTLYYNADDCQWQLESLSGTVYPFEYSDELTELFTPPDTTIVTLVGDIYTWFEWFYNEYANRGGSLDVTPIVSKLKDIENALANMGSDIDIENNTNININEENENYNIFYVDDPDGGEDKSIVDLSGDTLKVFGKLLDFLYKVSFKGSLDNAGSSIGDLSDFYLDTSEGSADLWVS